MRLPLVATLALSVGLIVPLQTNAAAAGNPGTAQTKKRDGRVLHGKHQSRSDARTRGRARKRSRPKPAPALLPTEPTATPAPESSYTPAPAPAQAAETTPTPAAAPAPTSAPVPEPTQAPQPPPASQPDGVIFRSNFESGFKGWYVQSIAGRATLVSTNPFQGGSATRFEVRDGDIEPDTGSERSEVSGPTFNEDEDLYIRDAIRVPSTNTYSAPWQIVQQLHEEHWDGSPGIAVFLDNKRTLKIGAGDSSPMYWQGPALQADRWYDLVYRVYLSQDSSQGFVEVWLDGVQQTMLSGQKRIYGETIQVAQTYLKAGIYRSKSSTGTSVVEHDQIVVGTSLGAVVAD